MSLEKENIDFLIALCKKNNRAAQEELYNRFYKAMYHTAYHFVKDPMRAEDIMQEGFITAFDYEEIGELLDMSYANCRTSLSRAREQLKAKLQAVENFK